MNISVRVVYFLFSWGVPKYAPLGGPSGPGPRGVAKYAPLGLPISPLRSFPLIKELMSGPLLIVMRGPLLSSVFVALFFQFFAQKQICLFLYRFHPLTTSAVNNFGPLTTSPVNNLAR